ncbi:MAG: double zinc ribbon domain-containing protein [Gemmatimonas sp.]|uniref:double zinc ribbon domain-containing protein n=1 Tax=Gemmatimonas sp. TaxID=1962908 RepID=UPI00391F586B
MALPDGAIPLLVGTALALGALTVVLAPLISSVDGTDTTERPRRRSATEEDDRPATAVDALREIEFDRETGKLSDADYADLKARYTQAALAELRASDAPSRAASDAVAGVATASVRAATLDPVEAAIARARDNQKACGVCGPRPEPDATYCSSCGRYLPGLCASCGTSIELVGSRFCSGCGEQLAAA